MVNCWVKELSPLKSFYSALYIPIYLCIVADYFGGHLFHQKVIFTMSKAMFVRYICKWILMQRALPVYFGTSHLFADIYYFIILFYHFPFFFFIIELYTLYFANF